MMARKRCFRIARKWGLAWSEPHFAGQRFSPKNSCAFLNAFKALTEHAIRFPQDPEGRL